MGTWGHNAFDNDTANDWKYGLEEVDDLSLVEETIAAALGDIDAEYLDADIACEALAACEVIARLRGNAGYRDSYTEDVDAWVKAHPQAPSPALVADALKLLDHVIKPGNELRELWEESGEVDDWAATVRDLRLRCAGA